MTDDKEKIPLEIRTTIVIPLVQIAILLGVLIRIWIFVISPGIISQRVGNILTSIPLWSTFWSLLIVFFGIFFVLYRIWFWRNNTYIIGKDQIIHQWGVFWRKRLILRFPTLDKIVVKKGFWGKLLGFGTLIIFSTETNENIELKNIPNPRKKSKLIQDTFPGPERV